MHVFSRSVQILPTQVLGVVGRHHAALSIDNLCLSHDQAFLVSSNQEGIQFWSMEDVPLLKRVDKGQEAAWEEEEGRRRGKRRRRKRKWKQREEEEEEEEGEGEGEKTKTSAEEFFADL